MQSVPEQSRILHQVYLAYLYLKGVTVQAIVTSTIALKAMGYTSEVSSSISLEPKLE